MKNIILLVSMFGLMACGDRNVQYVNHVQEMVNNPKDLSGYYYMEEGGEIELIRDHFDRYTVSTISTLFLTNVDASGVSFPAITITDKYLTLESELTNSVDLTFNAGHNVKPDAGGGNIVGARRTDVRFSLNDDGSITLKVEVYSATKANGGTLIFSKSVVGTR